MCAKKRLVALLLSASLFLLPVLGSALTWDELSSQIRNATTDITIDLTEDFVAPASRLLLYNVGLADGSFPVIHINGNGYSMSNLFLGSGTFKFSNVCLAQKGTRNALEIYMSPGAVNPSSTIILDEDVTFTGDDASIDMDIRWNANHKPGNVHLINNTTISNGLVGSIDHGMSFTLSGNGSIQKDSGETSLQLVVHSRQPNGTPLTLDTDGAGMVSPDAIFYLYTPAFFNDQGDWNSDAVDSFVSDVLRGIPVPTGYIPCVTYEYSYDDIEGYLPAGVVLSFVLPSDLEALEILHSDWVKDTWPDEHERYLRETRRQRIGALVGSPEWLRKVWLNYMTLDMYLTQGADGEVVNFKETIRELTHGYRFTMQTHKGHDVLTLHLDATALGKFVQSETQEIVVLDGDGTSHGTYRVSDLVAAFASLGEGESLVLSGEKDDVKVLGGDGSLRLYEAPQPSETSATPDEAGK